MSDTEIIEQLTQIIETQSGIIQKLHSALKQVGAATSIDGEVASVLIKAKSIIEG